MTSNGLRRVYIAGKMRGCPDWNRAAFDAAETRWRAAGWIVFSPAHALRVLDHDPGADPASGRYREQDRRHLNQAMQIDLACLYAADAVALLPGWETSYGVTVELALAQFLGLDVYDAVTMDRLRPPATPWAFYNEVVRAWRLVEQGGARGCVAAGPSPVKLTAPEAAGAAETPNNGHADWDDVWRDMARRCAEQVSAKAVPSPDPTLSNEEGA